MTYGFIVINTIISLTFTMETLPIFLREKLTLTHELSS